MQQPNNPGPINRRKKILIRQKWSKKIRVHKEVEHRKNVRYLKNQINCKKRNAYFIYLYKWPLFSCNISGTSGGGVGLGTGQLIAGQLGAASGSSRSHSRLTGGAIQHMVQAYATMNRFLARFLEHVTKIEL